jgi:ATP/maltotriose-dependent transcriptional regulator MalT
LDKDQLKRIYAARGWIGGVILLSESLLRRSDFSREKFIAQELPDYFNKEIFQYFGKEILSLQPKETQQFLLKSSIMNIIEPHFAEELFEIKNAEEILRDHIRKNLFVQSFYDENMGWLFRYHHMFRKFRKPNISQKRPPGTGCIKSKQGSSSGNWVENAIKYFLDAKAYPQTISLIERLGMDLLRKGRKSDLASWLYALPEELVQKNPWLLFYLSMTRQFMGGEENVISLEKAYQLFKENGETKGELICLAQLIATIAQTGIHLFPIHPLIQNAESLLGSTQGDAYLYERATLWNFTGQATFWLGISNRPVKMPT